MKAAATGTWYLRLSGFELDWKEGMSRPGQEYLLLPVKERINLIKEILRRLQEAKL
jgi:hypothetical protein